MIINADKMVLGRMATVAAKAALLGEEIKVVNCEKAVILGNKRSIIKDYLEKLELGQPQQGPFIQRRPDLFVKHAIRGMLPRKKPRGKDAVKRVMCYMGIPAEFAGKESGLKEASTSRTQKDYITVGELCMHLGDNKR